MNRFRTFALALACALTLTHSLLLAQILPPQGRLTLDTFQPVMTADVTGATVVYYYPYIGNSIPISNSTGFTFVNEPILPINNLVLNSSVHLAGEIYDVFAFIHSGQVTLGAGPAWSSSTTRSAALNTSFGTICNEFAITLTSGSNTYSIPISEATYLGTIYMTGNGETSMQFQPTPANGGPTGGAVLGVWNAYNRVRVFSTEVDNNSSWTYTNSTIRPADGSTNNRITWVDGLQQSSFAADYEVVGTAGGAENIAIGVGINSTTAYSGAISDIYGVTGAGGVGALHATVSSPPLVGLNYVQALESSPNGTVGTNSYQPVISTSQSYQFTLDTEM